MCMFQGDGMHIHSSSLQPGGDFAATVVVSADKCVSCLDKERVLI